MTDFLFREFGGIASPVVAGDVTNTQLFSAFDPALDRLLALFQTAINAELATAWAVARTGTPLAAVDPVADTIYQIPTKGLLRGAKFSFPLLCLARVSATHEDHSIVRQKITTTWSLDYLLGPLTLADYRRLGGTLAAVEKIVRMVIDKRGHPEYESGALQFFPTTGALASIRVIGSQMGPADLGDSGEGVEFHALHMDLETVELDAIVDDADSAPIEGITYTLGVGDGHEIIPAEIVAKTDAP